MSDRDRGRVPRAVPGARSFPRPGDRPGGALRPPATPSPPGSGFSRYLPLNRPPGPPPAPPEQPPPPPEPLKTPPPNPGLPPPSPSSLPQPWAPPVSLCAPSTPSRCPTPPPKALLPKCPGVPSSYLPSCTPHQHPPKICPSPPAQQFRSPPCTHHPRIPPPPQSPSPLNLDPLSQVCPLPSPGDAPLPSKGAPHPADSPPLLSSTMGEPRYLQADCAFRHGGHTVRLTLARSALEVEVEAHLTADQWRGEFDAACESRGTHTQTEETPPPMNADQPKLCSSLQSSRT